MVSLLIVLSNFRKFFEIPSKTLDICFENLWMLHRKFCMHLDKFFESFKIFQLRQFCNKFGRRPVIVVFFIINQPYKKLLSISVFSQVSLTMRAYGMALFSLSDTKLAAVSSSVHDFLTDTILDLLKWRPIVWVPLTSMVPLSLPPPTVHRI